MLTVFISIVLLACVISYSVTMYFAIRELRRVSQDAFIHLKAQSVEQYVHAQYLKKEGDIAIKSLQDALAQKEPVASEAEPKRKLYDVDGQGYSPDELEIL